MNPARTTRLPEAFAPATAGERAVSALCGLACAGLIFGALALSRSSDTAVAENQEVYVARQVTLPVDTPPPPPQPQERPQADAAAMASPIQLEVAASASPVHIQMPDVPLLSDEHVMPEARPTLMARFDLARSGVKPVLDMGDLDGRRVFERYEVDQPPFPIERVRPSVPGTLLADNAKPRTVMLFIVNTDGSVGEVRLLKTSRSEQFDQIIMETVRQWRFSPAVRKNRKVRCWVQQAITVQLGGGSPFAME
jgi:TonB family protein